MYRVIPSTHRETIPPQMLVSDANIHAGLVIHSWHGGCGLGWMQGFGIYNVPGSFSSWQDKAEWASALYKALYNPGNVIYSLATNSRMLGKQFENPAHQLLVEIGSRQIAEFPNLYHGPSAIAVFHVNVRDIVGMYCNVYGEPYKSVEDRNLSDRPAVILNDDGGLKNSNYASLPIRK